MIETRAPAPDYEGLYEVSDLGRVWVHDRATEITRVRLGQTQTYTKHVPGRILKPGMDVRRGRSNAYCHVVLTDYSGIRTQVKVHQLVLWAFVGRCPEGQETCHGNGNPTDNRLENLRWGTRKQNADDRARHGTSPVGERNPAAKLTLEQVAEIRRLWCSTKYLSRKDSARWTQQRLSEMFDVSLPLISFIVNNKIWLTG